MENGIQMTLVDLLQTTYQEPSVGASGSLAKIYQSPEINEDLKEIGRVSSSELCGLFKTSRKKIDPSSYSLRTLRTLLALIEDMTLPEFSLNWTGGGYNAEWRTLNSKDFGVPQNRERVFVIGHFRGKSGRGVLPIRTDNEEALKLQGHNDIISPTLLAGDRSSNGIYPISGGGWLKVNGFHKRGEE